MSIYKGKQIYSLSFMTYIARIGHKIEQLNEELRRLKNTQIVFKFQSTVWF